MSDDLGARSIAAEEILGLYDKILFGDIVSDSAEDRRVWSGPREGDKCRVETGFEAAEGRFPYKNWLQMSLGQVNVATGTGCIVISLVMCQFLIEWSWGERMRGWSASQGLEVNVRRRRVL